MTATSSRLVVLAGPTAVGKGTVAAYVRAHFPEVWLSVSMTTRKPRPGEVDGVHYHFVDDAEFDRLLEAGEFLEWAVVHGRAKYGTPRGPVDRALAAGAQGAAGDRPAGRAPGARADARGAVRVPARRRAGTSWCAGWSAGAPRPSRGARASGWPPRGQELAAEARVRRDHRQRRCSAGQRRTRIIDARPELHGAARRAATRDDTAEPNETRLTVSGTQAAPEGITNPPIDDLLTEAPTPSTPWSSTRAKRARQINAYYSQLGEGLLEYVGPLVETHVAREAAVDRAARDQRGPADLRADRGLSPHAGRPRPRRRPPCASSSASAAASPPTRPCLLLRLLTEAGHDVTVVPTAAALQLRRRAHLGGPVRQAGRHRRVDRRPRGAARAPRAAGRPGRRRPGHRRPAGPRRARAGRRPADHHAAHRPLPGAARPGDAHRDVGAPGHPAPTSRRCARAACRCVEPGLRPAHRRRHRPGPAARARRRSTPRAAPRCSAPAPPAPARRPGRPDAVVVSAGGTREPLDPVRFLGNRSSGKQGYALARSAAARGADVTLVAANTVAAGARPGVRGRAGRHRAGAAGRRHWRRPRTPTSWSWRPPPADFRPGALRRGQDQEDLRRRPGRRHQRADHRAGAQPRRPRRPGRRARGSGTAAGDRRVRRRDRRRDRHVLDHARAKLARKGCDLIVVNEVGVDKTFGPGHAPPCTSCGGGSERRRPTPGRPPRRRSRPRCGTSSQDVLPPR